MRCKIFIFIYLQNRSGIRGFGRVSIPCLYFFCGCIKTFQKITDKHLSVEQALQHIDYKIPWDACYSWLSLYRMRVIPDLVCMGWVLLLILFQWSVLWLYVSFVSFYWPWSCQPSDLMVSICPLGVFKFFLHIIISATVCKSRPPIPPAITAPCTSFL